MRNYESTEGQKQQNPMLGLIGFIILIVVAGFSFAVSGLVVGWLQGGNFSLGPLKVLPMQFPADWPPIADQIVVALALFLLIFVIMMVILFMFMKPPTYDERNVSLDEMRREVEARKRRR